MDCFRERRKLSFIRNRKMSMQPWAPTLDQKLCLCSQEQSRKTVVLRSFSQRQSNLFTERNAYKSFLGFVFGCATRPRDTTTRTTRREADEPLEKSHYLTSHVRGKLSRAHPGFSTA